jgi:uncharacterized membrane protein YphA (DoxX/SURF4 family)
MFNCLSRLAVLVFAVFCLVGVFRALSHARILLDPQAGGGAGYRLNWVAAVCALSFAFLGAAALWAYARSRSRSRRRREDV